MKGAPKIKTAMFDRIKRFRDLNRFGFTATKILFSLGGRFFPSLIALHSAKLFVRPRRQSNSTRRLPPPSKEFMHRGYDNLGVHARHWGENGPKILLLHGWESRTEDFSGFIAPLLEAGFQVVAIDAPAHGKSEGYEADMVMYSKTIEEVLCFYGPFDGVIGHSFGGVCLSWALGENPSIQLRQVVLLASPSGLLEVIEKAFDYFGFGNSVRKKLRNHLERRYKESLEHFAIERVAKRIRVPALIIHDKDDDIVKQESALKLHSHWPNSSLQFTEGLGHFRLLRNRPLILSIVDHLKKEAKAAA